MNDNRFFTLAKRLMCLVILSSANLSLHAWTPPQQISANDPCANPKVAIDPAGNITAIWISGTAPNTVVQSAKRPVSTGIWSSPVSITPTGFYHNPTIVMSSTGIATAAWENEKNGNISIESSRLPLSGNWANIKTVSQGGINQNPTLAVDSNNIVTAAWLKNDHVMAARTANNGNWGAPVTVYSAGGGNTTVELDINTANNLLLSWYNIGKNTTLASSYISNAWTNAVTIEPPATGNAGINSKALIGLNNAGNALAVWSDFKAGIKGKYNPTYNQAWSQTAAPVTTDFPNINPQVVLGSGGFGASIWINNTTGLVQGSSFINSAWTAPQVLSNSYDNDSTQLIIDGSNNAIAFWADNSVSDIKTSNFVNQSYWSYPPQDISTTGYNALPVAVGNANGKAVVAWIHNQGGNNVIQASTN